MQTPFEPARFGIGQLGRMLETGFMHDGSGTMVLPAVAIRALYESLIKEVKCFQNKDLFCKQINGSTCRDTFQCVAVVEEGGDVFELVVIENRKIITAEIVKNALRKFKTLPKGRFYYLTVSQPLIRLAERKKVNQLLRKIQIEKGCEIIVDGVLRTIQYHLRILEDPTQFYWGYQDHLKSFSLAITDPRRTLLRKWKRLLKENSYDEFS